MDASVAQSGANWHQSEPAEVGALEEHVEALTAELCKPAGGEQEPMVEKSQLAKLTEENAALSTEVASLKAALAAAEAETQRVATERDEALQLKAELDSESAHAALAKKAAEQRTFEAQVKDATNAQRLSTEVPAAAPSVHQAADALEARSALARKRGPPQDSPDGLSEEEGKLRRSDQRE